MFLPTLAALLCLSRPAFPQVNGIEVADGATASVFGGKSPMVKVTDAEGTELASIPIEKNPGAFIYSKSSNTVYVVHNEKKNEHFVSAVNLTTLRVDKEIKVGSGVAVELLVSDDGRRLFCYTASNRFGAADRGGFAYIDNSLKAPFQPLVNVVDTASNEVIATYDWFGAFREDLHKTFFFANQLLGASDSGYLIVRSEAKTRMFKPIKDRLMVFSGQSSHPTIEFDPGGKVVGAMFSKDEKLLFVAVEGDKKTEGSLVVADLEKGTTVTHALADHPTSFFRLGSAQEAWLLGTKEMRSLSEAGEPGDRRIPLNKPHPGEEKEAGDPSAFLDGVPGETISLGDDRAAIQINNKRGGSHHKVALVDLKKLQVDAIIPTMSAGEKAGIRTARIMTAIALTAATGGVLIFTPNIGLRNESLAARPDGRFLFALDLEGHEVTAVDVQTATVAKRIAVNKSITKLRVSADGTHLICLGKRTQQINLESNNLEN
jgi:DNA-binding beta-propeller fold protein YncE